MSNLISSFILEPVVRQARRFSLSPAARDGADFAPIADARLSRACESGQAIEQSHSLDIGESNSSEDTRHIESLDDSLVPATSDNGTNPIVTPIGDADAAPPFTEVPPGSTVAGHVRLARSPTSRTSPSSTNLTSLEDQRSSNPSYGIPAHFRPRQSVDSSHPSRRTPGRALTYPTSDSPRTVTMSESLPADDGMRILRQKIHEIRDMEGPSEEKAKRMHSLMTERYHMLHGHITRARSPSSVLSQDRPFTPSSIASGGDSHMHLSSPTSLYSATDNENHYKLTMEDMQPTFRPPKQREPLSDLAGETLGMDEEEEEPSLGCEHYKRNVKIQCFDCNRWYTCRHCHDEHEDHRLNRKQTRNMFCMLCATPQPAGEFCRSCQGRTAWWYCDICKLWDDDNTKRIYHCPDCGICRRGEGLGKDFVHCKRCNVCISIRFAEDHRCIERATDCDCPICGDYMFTSSTDVVAMPCGHYMHRECYKAYMETGYKCPICKKSCVNMELQWRKLEDAIESQPMPAQFADTRMVIHCNDCSVKSTVKYHWLGNQCAHCDSFNTNEVQLLTGDDAEPVPATDTPTDPISIPRPRPQSLMPMPEVVRRSSGSYFQLAEMEAEAERNRPRSADGMVNSFSPFEFLSRVRSYSPVRHLLGGSDEEMEDLNDDDDDDDDSEMDENEEMDDEELDDADEDEDEEDLLGDLELIGHR